MHVVGQLVYFFSTMKYFYKTQRTCVRFNIVIETGPFPATWLSRFRQLVPIEQRPRQKFQNQKGQLVCYTKQTQSTADNYD